MDRTDLDGDPSGTWPLVGQTNVQIPTGPQYNRLSDYSHDVCSYVDAAERACER